MSKKLDSLVDKIVDQIEGRIRKIVRQEFEYYLEDKGGSGKVMHDKSSGSPEPETNENIKQRMSEAVKSDFNPKLSNHPSMAGGEDVADVRYGENAQKFKSMVTKDYSNLID